MIETEKRFLNELEISEYLGFSISVVRKWVRRGLIPFHKVDGRVCFDMESINEWLERERAGSAKG